MRAPATGYTAPGGEPLRGHAKDTHPGVRITLPFLDVAPVTPGDILTHADGGQALVLDTHHNGHIRPLMTQVTITAARINATAAILRRPVDPDAFGRTPDDLQEVASGIPIALTAPAMTSHDDQPDRHDAHVRAAGVIEKDLIIDGDAVELTWPDGTTQRLTVGAIDPWTWPAHDRLELLD